MRTSTHLTTIACAGALLLACAAETPAEPPLSDVIDASWAGALWDDGQAEVATYDGHRFIYGADRPHTARLITVKEDFNEDLLVKADWPYGDTPIVTVLKQNQVATIDTPNYPYHMMASVFFERDDIGDAVKLAVSSQEWCGATFKVYDLHADPPVMHRSSYWDGEGTGRATVDSHTGDAYFEEELPLLVRTLKFEDGLEAEFLLQPNQTTTKAPIPEPVEAQLVVRNTSTDVSVPAGTVGAGEAWIVEVSASDGREMQFLVADDEANTLVSYDLGDGRRYELREVERRAYWELP